MYYYVLLAAAILLEVGGSSMLKYADGFSKIVPSAISVLFYIASLVCISKALTHLNLGIAYATWCAGGIILTCLISYFFFQERLTFVGVLSLTAIIVGCVVLNLYGTAK